MPSFKVTETVPFSREQVFSAGIVTSNWPHVAALTIEPSGEVLMPDTIIRTEIDRLNLGLECAVTEYEMYERIRLEGKSKLARVALQFVLTDIDRNNTAVNYSLDFELSNKMPGRRLASPIIRQILKKSVPEFAEGYKQNITNYLTIK